MNDPRGEIEILKKIEFRFLFFFFLRVQYNIFDFKQFCVFLFFYFSPISLPDMLRTDAKEGTTASDSCC